MLYIILSFQNSTVLATRLILIFRFHRRLQPCYRLLRSIRVSTPLQKCRYQVLIGNEEDLDVTAHLLRRTIATFWANGGVPIEYVDAILGHENPENKKINYASIDKAQEICAMIDRAIHLGSLCQTCNPAYTPVDISSNTSAKLKGNASYSFIVQEDTFVSLNLSCLEAGQPIKITVSDSIPQLTLFADSLLDKNNLLSPRDTIETNHSSPILPALPSPEEVESWIREANQIDLTEIIMKWRQ